MRKEREEKKEEKRQDWKGKIIDGGKETKKEKKTGLHLTLITLMNESYNDETICRYTLIN